MKKSPAAVSGPVRAMEIIPSLCASPVSLVRSSAIGGNASFSRAGFGPAWITSIFTALLGWLSGLVFTVRWKTPPS